ncbi:hypothetical protein pah_c026o124 [Parachlamydia acanthamoebae str. Hall's coccus]|nr:hypothetical protein pah_c026o124 [Parachlamydia acanthamoebae str. Hall's coccus]
MKVRWSSNKKNNPMRKKQYIFEEGDEFIPSQAELANQGTLIKLPKA